MPRIYWEDFTPGSIETYGPRVVTREEIVAFAAEFDPQPMHLDEEAARATLLGGLAASGWHSCAIVMRMICDGFMLDSSSMGSGGIDEVRWLRPLRPGDSVTVRRTTLETRASRSRPNMGTATFLFELVNQHGETVMTMRCTIMFGRRKTAPAASAASAS
ncbi:MAG TPA: MaoC family dehydratase [Xanthobacteraceae bacterium]|nr:MaoC family dehydratase [Xanthobacteraceae bacterium]